MIEVRSFDRCRCGHDRALHDLHGCAAFLGAFPETADQARYCGCRQMRAVPALPPAPRAIVATVRVRARRGSAVATCDAPAHVVLDADEDHALAALKRRLVARASGPTAGAMILVVRSRGVDEEISVERLDDGGGLR